MKMPVITLWQPWAQLISEGLKTIETRTHKRFECLKNKQILIHAGSKYDKKCLNEIEKYIGYKIDIDYIEPQILCSAFVFDFKKIDNIEDEYKSLVDCKDVVRYGLYLKDIKKFNKTIKIKGKQGIWYFDFDQSFR